MDLGPIAQRIKALMAERGLENPRDLERAVGIPYHRSYSWFRRYTAVPNAEDMETLAAFFRVPVGHILNGDPIPDSDPREALVEAYADLTPERRRQAEQFVKFLLQEQHAASAAEPSQD